MKKLVVAALFAACIAGPAFAEEQTAPPAASQPTAAAAAAAPVSVRRFQTIFTADGRALGQVYSVAADGTPSVIFDNRVIGIPLATLTMTDGKVVTSLTRRQLRGG